MEKQVMSKIAEDKIEEVKRYINERLRTGVVSLTESFQKVIDTEPEDPALPRSDVQSMITMVSESFIACFDVDSVPAVNFSKVFIEHGDNQLSQLIQAYINFLHMTLGTTANQLNQARRIFAFELTAERSKLMELETNMVHHFSQVLHRSIMTLQESLIHDCQKKGKYKIEDFEWITPKGYFFFDVESIGVRGEAFAFGYVVTDSEGNVIEEEAYWFEPKAVPEMMSDTETHSEFEAGMEWVKEHCLPTLRESDARKIDEGNVNKSISALRSKFIELWDEFSDTCYMVADCPYPIETNFLRRVNREVYPLLDVASMLLMCGKDPMGTYTRLADELPAHHPLMDARQTKRLFFNLVKGDIGQIQYLYPKGASDGVPND